jgi:AraC-like DNA-binding protein
MPVHAIIDSAVAGGPCFYPPTPQNSLFFYLRDTISAQFDPLHDFQQQPRAVIVGPQTKPVHLLLQQEHLAIRVGFHPAGLFRLLGIPLHQLLDKSFDAADFFGRPLLQLVDQLQHAAGFDEMVKLVESFLLQQMNRQKQVLPFDYAMKSLLRSGGTTSINQIASIACLSNRQLERVCKDRIGLSPKYFARLIRFSRAYRMREEQPHSTWTSIAHQVGYFDQMHLIRDFREFTCQSPTGIEKELQLAPLKMQRDLKL